MAQNDELEKNETEAPAGDPPKTPPAASPVAPPAASPVAPPAALPATPPPKDGDDLEKKVKEAEDALKKAKEALAAKAAAAQQEKASDGVKTAYEAAKPGLDQTQTGLKTFVDDEKSLLTKAVPDAATLIKSVTDSEAKARKPFETALGTAEVAADNAKKALETARAERDDQKKSVMEVERSLARIRERQSQADRKRLAVSKAHDGGEPAFAYWLLEKELEPLVDGEPEVVDADALKASVLAARAELATREEAVRGQEKAVDDANSNAEAKRRDLAEFDQGAEARIRKQLKTATPPDGGESSTPKP